MNTTSTMDQPLAYSDSPTNTNARVLLGLMLVAAVIVVVTFAVATRGNIGTDTSVYASFFESLQHHGETDSRFEPVFYYLSVILAATGMSFTGYEGVMFLVMMGTALVATRRYHTFLESETGYTTFLAASLLFLFISPVMSNATINVMRQGLSSLLVFTALLAFYQRQWRAFILWGLLATGFHYSALLYLFFAPVLLLNTKLLRVAGILAFLAYCSGVTMVLVRALVPAVYTMVMAYDAGSSYKAGVRLDFAVFSLFWYVLPWVVAPFVREPVRERINQSTAIYLVLMLPFFAVGWGNFSNRYLLPAWLSVSLILAAICCDSRLSPLRNPVVLRMGLVGAGGVFCYYVTHGVVL
ncbi:EpsG family protein [Frateuria edaphi]|uniref:EpsG family protein n=1 Tax=Frateuria edaphi TaxID=2898793 RepID=UPI001E552FE6|nr:EpsG family protein [Frateuria edaphi]UGB46051.1 EpsG family protein [Frateuria edaphi]